MPDSLFGAVREVLECRTRHDGPPLAEGETLSPGCPACDATEALNKIEGLMTRVSALLVDLNAGYDNAETRRQTRLLIEELS